MIISYIGTETEVEIPESINGIPVTKIGKDAFNSHITKTELTSVTFSEGLLEIGENAFQNNDLGDVELPTCAYISNNITSVDLTGITSIGDSAFEDNQITTVTLPDTLTSYGEHVFLNNGCFVKLLGNTDIAEIYGVDGSYGEFYGDLRTITIKFVDEDGTPIPGLSDKVIEPTTIVKSLSKLPVDGVSYVFNPPAIKGYGLVGGVSQKFKINGDTEHIVRYLNQSSLPVISGADSLFQIDTGENLLLSALMKGVTATDADSTDLTNRITISNWKDISTEAPGIYTIVYRVEGKNGITSVNRKVAVGSDLMKMEIGNGWRYEDFLYSEDGTAVLGLSDIGDEKYNGADGKTGNTELVLPGFHPLKDTRITSVGGFGEYGFTAVDFGNIEKLTRVEDEAFKTSVINDLGSLSFADLTYIGSSAFRSTRPSLLDFSNCTKLKEIGDDAFFSAGCFSRSTR